MTHLRSHVDWFTADAPDAWQEIARLDTVGITLERVALVPLPLFRELAQAEAIARTVAQQRRALPAGRLHPLLQLGRRSHGKSAVQRGPLGSGSGFAYR
ncbi:putative cytosine deaminase [Klebsiella pneumoniae]|uniref:Putative cytosine deaminase n=1 Tax=Klebsiella pneumoniae TaxID=573 RepID=A0A377XB72_KLEPN|nr:putative cytosine deaminase [Klebsiella pneumoniae]